MKEIGGYFELELSHGTHYHKDALRLNSARSCLEYVLRARRYKKVYLPHYTCEIVVQPFRLMHIDYEFYHINEKLEPIDLPVLKDNEAFLYTNYFGLKQCCIERLASHYGTKLIVDNAQAFFAPVIVGVDTFYSPRKFFGVPDGGYLYCDVRLNEDFPQATSYDRMSHLLKRTELGAQAGYSDFRYNDDHLAEQPIMRMSLLTEKLLESIDYQNTIQIRRNNFRLLKDALNQHNLLKIEEDNHAVPMAYPYLTEAEELKLKLIDNKIFAATYWPNVLEWCEPNDWEYTIAKQACFLPLDQRYGEEAMLHIIKTISQETATI